VTTRPAYSKLCKVLGYNTYSSSCYNLFTKGYFYLRYIHIQLLEIDTWLLLSQKSITESIEGILVDCCTRIPWNTGYRGIFSISNTGMKIAIPPSTSTYIHTYTVHTYIHTYIHAYTHTCMHAYMHTCIHTYIHAYSVGKHQEKWMIVYMCVCAHYPHKM